MSTSSLFSTPPLQAPQPTQSAPASTGSAQAVAAPQQVMTEDDLKRALPNHLKSAVTPHMVQTLNSITSDPIAAENIRDNLIGYTSVLKDGKFKTEEYINAVAYVSFKLMGHTNEDAYARAFPQRYSALLAKNTSKKDISSYVSAYHRGKLVNLIMEQTLVPTWVLNQDIHQKAINTLADLMINANSEKVQAEAAIGLLTHLKKPEPKGDFQINLNQAESSGMKEMREMITQLAQTQQELIKQGDMKTIDVASSRLVQKDDVEDVN